VFGFVLVLLIFDVFGFVLFWFCFASFSIFGFCVWFFCCLINVFVFQAYNEQVTPIRLLEKSKKNKDGVWINPRAEQIHVCMLF